MSCDFMSVKNKRPTEKLLRQREIEMKGKPDYERRLKRHEVFKMGNLGICSWVIKANETQNR